MSLFIVNDEDAYYTQLLVFQLNLWGRGTYGTRRNLKSKQLSYICSRIVKWTVWCSP